MSTYNCNNINTETNLLLIDNNVKKRLNYQLLKYTLENIKIDSATLYICIINIDFKNFNLYVDSNYFHLQIEKVIKVLEYYYEKAYDIIVDLEKVLDYSVTILLPELYQIENDINQIKLTDPLVDPLINIKFLYSYIMSMISAIEHQHKKPSRKLYMSSALMTLPFLTTLIEHEFQNSNILMNVYPEMVFKYSDLLKTELGTIRKSNQLLYTIPPITTYKFNHVYVGGFFDYFHLGHKEYLSIGALVSKNKFFISVLQKPSISNNSFTSNSSLGDIMNSRIDSSPLKSKDDLSQSIDIRMDQIRQFFRLFHPHHSSIEIITNNRCNNIALCPMTFVEIGSIAIIVPTETIQTAEKLNEIRNQRQLTPIQLFKIKELTHNQMKICSTNIRALVFSRINAHQNEVDI
ncbi:hypothetical protein DLAC_08143 [Tieghemostelium lacteum]|uniref:Cytidyltransferase-like domain-containing protein n=1 Tax=Tieghemostelium lacteum TaxID=361077 RepID=A0A151ZB94_TIELA|nr:hypothetical protein DLAC_08143 [Tieghemostelium lacteum]|eukprot:KYQ91217.1 hypothetical protein DLAC_08143 [Tieghemostelium lacteum]